MDSLKLTCFIDCGRATHENRNSHSGCINILGIRDFSDRYIQDTLILEHRIRDLDFPFPFFSRERNLGRTIVMISASQSCSFFRLFKNSIWTKIRELLCNTGPTLFYPSTRLRRSRVRPSHFWTKVDRPVPISSFLCVRFENCSRKPRPTGPWRRYNHLFLILIIPRFQK